MYRYEDHKAWTMTDEGQRAMFKIMDKARSACREAGCVTSEKLMSAAGISGSSWDFMAAIDRLVEIDQLLLVADVGAWQQRVYVTMDSLR